MPADPDYPSVLFPLCKALGSWALIFHTNNLFTSYRCEQRGERKFEIHIAACVSWLLDRTTWNCQCLTVFGFPGSSASKEPTFHVGDLGSVPGLGRSPRERKRLPTLVLASRIPWTVQSWDHKESDTTERLSLWLFLTYRNGNSIWFKLTFLPTRQDRGPSSLVDCLSSLTVNWLSFYPWLSDV